jgi:hypothetical protein
MSFTGSLADEDVTYVTNRRETALATLRTSMIRTLNGMKKSDQIYYSAKKAGDINSCCYPTIDFYAGKIEVKKPGQ